jgi:hypothetical protein
MARNSSNNDFSLPSQNKRQNPGVTVAQGSLPRLLPFNPQQHSATTPTTVQQPPYLLQGGAVAPAIPSVTTAGPATPYLAGRVQGYHHLSASAASMPMRSTSLPLSRIPENGANSAQSSSTRPLLHTPEIFLNRKLRSGKWIPQEEMYAERLIELFEKGRIAGCENGCTLRWYLSQKLHCAPMRISKKFAGKGIGKMVYVSKMNHPSGSHDADQEELLKRVEEVQEKYYQAVCPAKDPKKVCMVWKLRGCCASFAYMRVTLYVSRP